MRTATLLILLLLLGMIAMNALATPLHPDIDDSTRQALDLYEDDEEEDEEEDDEGGVLGGSLDMITLALYAALVVAIVASIAPYAVKRLRAKR